MFSPTHPLLHYKSHTSKTKTGYERHWDFSFVKGKHVFCYRCLFHD
jgi:hypothetical protein